ncbi:MAG: hypothetical protein VYA34_16485 [Myxococcota bacterium]|nr:hypothetical protein [Myxococcota bacterium]
MKNNGAPSNALHYFRKSTRAIQGVKWFELVLQKSLFGDTDLICRSGSIGRARVKEKVESFADNSSVWKRIEKIRAKRLSEGYIQVC